MLKGKAKGIVVANYSPELEELRKEKSIYFTKQQLAKGVLEGIQHHLTAVDSLGSSLNKIVHKDENATAEL